jgi:hypothetical protein
VASRQANWASVQRPGPAEEAAHGATRSPRIVRTRDGTVARSSVARWRLAVRCTRGALVGPRGSTGQGGGRWGSPRTSVDGEEVQVASGGGV